MRRFHLSLLVLLALLIVGPLGSASADLADLVLIEPANGSTVTATTFLFTWEPSMAITYKFVLQSKDGLQKTTIIYDNDGCGDTICALQFSPADQGWTWRENVVYKWWIVSRDNLNVPVLKSIKHKFTTNVLPETIVLTDPAHDLTVTNPNVVFQWEVDDKFDAHRVVITGPEGKTNIAWSHMATFCDIDGCGAEKSFAGLPNGVYKWKVQGTRDFVSGQVTSEKRKFTLAVP